MARKYIETDNVGFTNYNMSAPVAVRTDIAKAKFIDTTEKTTVEIFADSTTKGLSQTFRQVSQIDSYGNNIQNTYIPCSFSAYTDFMIATANSGFPHFTGAAIASGTITTCASDDRTGVVNLRCNTTTNGGYNFLTDPSAIHLNNGGWGYACEFAIPTTAATIRLGFFDSITTTAPVDCCMLEISATSARPKCRSNNTETSGAEYYITTGAWYTATIKVETSASAIFELFDVSGTRVMLRTITTNIPVASGRQTGAGCFCITPITTATTLLNMDWMVVGKTSQDTKRTTRLSTTFTKV